MTAPPPAPHPGGPPAPAPPAGPPDRSLPGHRSSPLLQQWLQAGAIAAVVVLLGFWEIVRLPYWLPHSTADSMLMVAVLGCAAGLYRLAPGAALALAWASAMVQALTRVDLMLTQLAAVLVVFGTARYGRPLVVWLGGLSVPAAVLFAMLLVRRSGLPSFDPSLFLELQPSSSTVDGLALVAMTALALLSMPWLLGMVLRLQERARRSREDREAAEQQRRLAEEARETAEAERSHAEEIARLREGQTDLARDVHDVVGHSLAVILAQAESAQYLPEDDTERVQRTMANIATSARQSLQDVRQVLSAMADPDGSATMPSGSPDDLLDDVRATGSEVQDRVIGAPRALPPELETVAFRVLQEMLTNALKHGRRTDPVLVEREWGDTGLRIEVRNTVTGHAAAADETVAAPAGSGLGLTGMRRRLETVGGTLEVCRTRGGASFTDAPPASQEAPGHSGHPGHPGLQEVFTATAWLPVAQHPNPPGP